LLELVEVEICLLLFGGEGLRRRHVAIVGLSDTMSNASVNRYASCTVKQDQAAILATSTALGTD
jgi:hypothetical protein